MSKRGLITGLSIVVMMLLIGLGIAGAETLTIPPNTLTIEDEAFFGDHSIDAVELPEGIIEIGERAFSTSSAKKIYLPLSIKKIGTNAFSDCPALTCTGFSGSYAEEYCKENHIPFVPISGNPSDFEYEEINGVKAKITGYKGNDSIIVIPDEIDDFRITSIASKVFSGKSGIITVFLPKHLERIETNQFNDCTNLNTVYIQDKIQIIGDSAFTNCQNLKNVVFTETEALTEVGAYAFRNCKALKSIALPDTVQTIGASAFENCSSLSNFHYPSSWTKVKLVSDGGPTARIFRDCKELKRVEIPKGVKAIPGYAFLNCNYLEEVVLPEGLEVIGFSAFANTEAMKGIRFPASLTTIEDSAFQGCEWLENLDGLTGTSLTKIRYYAFRDCINLQSANLPDTVTEIGMAAFDGCTSLASFHYPMSWTKVELVSDGEPSARIFRNCKKLKKIEVPEGIKKIPGSAFCNCNYLREVVLPEGLEVIGSSAFFNTESMTGIHFPASLTTIEDSAFRGCEWLENLDDLAGTSLIKIGYFAFRNCTNLQSANLPDTVIEIGMGAFEDCASLASFHYPLSWEKVYLISDGGPQARIFKGCKKLQSIVIPEGVKKIPKEAFLNCDCLLHVQIPYSVVEIGEYAFYGDKVLQDLYLSENVSKIGSNAFGNAPELIVECEWGTYALDYLKENNIKYYYLSRTGAYRLNGANWPLGQMYRGEPYIFNGFVRSSINLTNVSANIYLQNTNTAVRTFSISPGVTDYGLQNEFSTSMSIDYLELGKYRFVLEGATDGHHEILVDNNFEVIPAPLKINIWDMVLPQGYIEPTFALSGVLRANYPISSATFTIWENNAGVLQKTVSPQKLTFDLTEISSLFDFSTLSRNKEMRFTIDVVTTGGTVDEVVNKSFIVSENKTAYSNEEYAAIVQFAAKQSNRELFDKASSYAKDYLYEEMDDTADAWLIGINDLFDIAWEEIRSHFGGKNGYLVELYKGQIAKTIKDVTGREFKQYDKNHIAVQLIDWISKGTSNSMKTAKVDLPAETWNRLAPICDILSPAVDVLRQVKTSVELADELTANFANMASANFKEIAILESVRESLTTGDNKSDEAFMEAMEEIYEEYTGELSAALKPLVDLLLEEMRKNAIKEIITNVIGKDAATAYSVSKFALKLCNKVAGLDTEAKTKKEFLAGFDNCSKASKAFKAAFDRVAQGDDSQQAINSLYYNYCYARSSWRSMMDFLKKNWLPGKTPVFDEVHNKLRIMKFPGIEN